jgi:XTP/dITP diphosphohydrolase
MYGEIIDTPRGDGGFGYDPYFLIPELGQTGAEVPMELKNQISHRGKALASLVEKLRENP